MSKVYTKTCRRCGLTFETDKPNKRYCIWCGESSEDRLARKREENKKKKLSPLDALLKEIREYNDKHGTSLSYGQYVSKFGK